MLKQTLEPHEWAGLEALRDDVEQALRRSCRDVNELEDLVQETLLRAARFRNGLQHPARLRSWVLRIAWNVLRDHVRRQGRIRVIAVSEGFLNKVEGRERSPGDLPQQQLMVGRRYVDRSELAELLIEVVPDLREDERALLIAYYMEERGCIATGQGIGISPERVKMRLYRLRSRLRRELKRRTGLASASVRACHEVVA